MISWIWMHYKGFFHDKVFLVRFSLYHEDFAVAIFIDFVLFRVFCERIFKKCRGHLSLRKVCIYLISWPQWFANILDLVDCKHEALVGMSFQVKELERIQSHAHSKRQAFIPLDLFVFFIDVSFHWNIFASVSASVFENKLIPLLLYLFNCIVV